ncbi:LlaJI family restriction endonuclease [Clostridium sp.]|uniref:LlaJI family restriction endonuclease n=1 Tax=Clostridium sp. TaxID=1506 RepID=UPI0026096B20|nr:LlaJI family restriction endonuclease [Clostridium sp.]
MLILKELESYSKLRLYEKLSDSKSIKDKTTLEDILNILVKRSIIKYDRHLNIKFDYVGLVVVKNIPIFVKPKYSFTKDKDIELVLMKNIIKLLNDFSEREKLDSSNIESIEFEAEIQENNLISIINFLLEDYIENGLYENEINSYELNGDGDIDWDKTIDQINPLVINNQWVYTDLITKNNIIDNNRFITMLHAKVINECTELLNRTSLNIILKYDIEELENSIDSIEDKDYIFYEIDKEITVQFSDRKRRILKAIKSYLEKKSGAEESDLLLYGTRNFKWIWEVICGYIFDNEFIKDGNISKYEKYGIASPEWTIYGNGILNTDEYNILQEKKNRLTPDVLKVTEYNGEKYLLILDAKYYNVIVEENKIKGNPGIEDITKQYLYHSALKYYMSKECINENNVINAFLFPSELESYIQGEVKIGFMHEFSNNQINLVQLNVNEVIDMYCNNKRYDLNKFIDEIRAN